MSHSIIDYSVTKYGSKILGLGGTDNARVLICESVTRLSNCKFPPAGVIFIK
ncbi:MAG: hypothetical protein ACM31M_02740 [Nitrososphaerota archaeon]